MRHLIMDILKLLSILLRKEPMLIQKTKFDKEELYYFANHKQTPLHKTSEHGQLEIVKYLIEKGANVKSVWSQWLLEYRTIFATLINNFNDPFYQRIDEKDEIKTTQMNTLIENGMI